ncbi:hypothetical protein, partial [Lactiplantibacillus plantarum]
EDHVLNTGLPLTKPKTLTKWNFTAEHWPKRLPVVIVCEWPTWVDPALNELDVAILKQRFYHTTVSLII